MVHFMEKYLKPRKRSSTSSCDQESDLEEPASKTIALLNLLLRGVSVNFFTFYCDNSLWNM